MLIFLAKRLGYMVVTMVVVSGLLFLLPRDIAGQRGDQGAGSVLVRGAAQPVARGSRIFRAPLVSLLRLARPLRHRRFRPIGPLQGAGRRCPVAEAVEHGHSRVVDLRRDDPAVPGARRPGRHAGGLEAGPDHLGDIHRHHLGAGIRQRRPAGRHLRLLAQAAARHQRHDGWIRVAADGAACDGAGALRLRLRDAHDPGLDGGSDDHPLHPHRHPQGTSPTAR